MGGTPLLVAIADGFGPGFGLELDKAGGYPITLARDDIPVEGRILDTEGRPVVGRECKSSRSAGRPKRT